MTLSNGNSVVLSVGGDLGGTETSDSQAYNIADGTWTLITNHLPHPLMGVRSVKVNNHFYIVGGMDDTNTNRDEVYKLTVDGSGWNLQTDVLTEPANLPMPLMYEDKIGKF